METYYAMKKKNNLIFTEHNISVGKNYDPTEVPLGLPWWSKELGRYRTAEEQKEWVKQMLEKGKVVIQ